MALANVIRELEEHAPRLHARWSERSWRLACEGPATRLWDALAGAPGADHTLVDYLVLLREAVGLQYLSAVQPADLDPANPAGAGASFLGTALCDVAPRLVPKLPPGKRGAALARLWNAGEKLQSRPVWLNRYLAARLRELESLDGFDTFLARAIAEGLEEVSPSAFAAPFAWSTLDLAAFDRMFLPGEAHLATPSIACLHDRRRDRHIGLLLRPSRAGGPLCLGVTPCLGRPPRTLETRSALDVRIASLRAAAVHVLPDQELRLAAPGGHLLITSPTSQRVWLGEAAR